MKELCSVIRRGVFCVHKPGFLMPGHIFFLLLQNKQGYKYHNNYIEAI